MRGKNRRSLPQRRKGDEALGATMRLDEHHAEPDADELDVGKEDVRAT